MKRFIFSPIVIFCFVSGVIAQTIPDFSGEILLSHTAGVTYYQVERSNWSKYVNGKYIGLAHRETRANVSCKGSTNAGIRFSGFFYVLEETLKDMTKASQGIDATIASDFVMTPSGQMIFSRDEGLPQLRNFPAFPETPVQTGDRWQSGGYRSVDPKNDGKRTLLPILVEYTLAGAEVYHDLDVFRIRAKYATRLDIYHKNKSDDPSLNSATGTHDADILVDKETGAVVLIIDRMDESYFYADGSSIRLKGNTAIFTEYPVMRDRGALIARAADIGHTEQLAPQEKSRTLPKITPQETLKETPTETADTVTAATNAEPTQAFAVEDTPQGIRLSVKNLQFEADSDKILASEIWRLDAIAKTLLLVKDGHYLVEGHTAAVGKAAGEKELSIQRAKKVVDELAARGLRAEQFIFTGYGGTRPVADNSTAEGRAANRRVEITIME